MNKTTKIALNYGLGTAITALLLWNLYTQVTAQLHGMQEKPQLPTGALPYLIAALLLIPVNLGMEARKWQLLAGNASPINYAQAWKSLLGGIAFSIITPNRIGEYPGRILFLGKKKNTRLISVSILGGTAQLLAVLLAGTCGLIYYCFHFPGLLASLTLAGSLLCSGLVAAFYWRFERWTPHLERIRWLQRYLVYGQMLRRFTAREQGVILLISVLRFAVFTSQYLLMLRWMHIDLPLADGFFLCALFFWVMAVIPSIALAELGVRGQVSLFLFHTFTANKIGILGATIGLWGMNLVLPALAGSLLLVRLRLVR